jgi:hypothetical protein
VGVSGDESQSFEEFPKWFNLHPYIPPNSSSNDSSYNLIFTEVGRICTQFERLNGLFVYLFDVLFREAHLGTSNIGLIVALLRSQDGFQTRKNIAESISERVFFFSPEKQKRVKKNCELIGRCAVLRNLIAHGRVMDIRGGSNADMPEGISLGFLLLPGEKNLVPRKYDPDTFAKENPLLVKFKWNSKDLSEVSRCIELAYQRVYADLKAWRESYSGPMAPIGEE